jgi:hypothetical protein
MNDPNDDLPSLAELAIQLMELKRENEDLRKQLNAAKRKSEPYLPSVEREPLATVDIPVVRDNEELHNLLQAGARRLNQQNFSWWFGFWACVIVLGFPFVVILLFSH